MGKIIGIDLGTTNSCVAFLEGGIPKIIENSEGDRTTPSIIGYADDDEVLMDLALEGRVFHMIPELLLAAPSSISSIPSLIFSPRIP